jgi:hypothetical protein
VCDFAMAENGQDSMRCTTTESGQRLRRPGLDVGRRRHCRGDVRPNAPAVPATKVDQEVARNRGCHDRSRGTHSVNPEFRPSCRLAPILAPGTAVEAWAKYADSATHAVVRDHTVTTHADASTRVLGRTLGHARYWLRAAQAQGWSRAARHLLPPEPPARVRARARGKPATLALAALSLRGAKCWTYASKGAR